MSRCAWLPEWIVGRHPNVVALVLCRDAYIYKVWVNHVAAINAPIDPHTIPGSYVWDFLEPEEADHIQMVIQDVISRQVAHRGIITLTIPVESRQRLVRFLPLNNDAVLAYLVRRKEA